MESPSRLIIVVCVCIRVRTRMCVCVCVFFFDLQFSISPICFPPLIADTCCNKVNEVGKWQDSRWYFSKPLPSNNTVVAAGSWASEWDASECVCVRARLCIMCTGLECNICRSLFYVGGEFAHPHLNAEVLLYSDNWWGCFILFFFLEGGGGWGGLLQIIRLSLKS